MLGSLFPVLTIGALVIVLSTFWSFKKKKKKKSSNILKYEIIYIHIRMYIAIFLYAHIGSLLCLEAATREHVTTTR